MDGREIPRTVPGVFGPERGGALIAAAAGNSDQQGQHADD
jgi:hypothetical protein